ncbi:hypothetical protein DMUE_3364 [Dictyocoela muelleri]|nr:hypothetical protein DMUE_3364 [Dictyocoela muelleri]
MPKKAQLQKIHNQARLGIFCSKAIFEKNIDPYVVSHFYKFKIFHDQDSAINFLKEIQAIKEIIKCSRCEHEVRLKKIMRKGVEQYIYRCTTKGCGSEKNILSSSIFRYTKLDLPALLFSVFLAINNTHNHLYNQLFSIGEKTYISIKNKLTEIYSILIENNEKIGGKGIYVEIDEFVISRQGNIRSPSSADDNLSCTIWLVGAIERDNIRRFKMKIVPDRTILTLTEFIRKHIKPGTIVVTDGHRSYPCAVRNNGMKHIIVPHVEGFVNSDGESTKKIENLWSHLKAEIRKENGVQFANIKEFLVKFAFKKTYITGSDTKIIFF